MTCYVQKKKLNLLLPSLSLNWSAFTSAIIIYSRKRISIHTAMSIELVFHIPMWESASIFKQIVALKYYEQFDIINNAVKNNALTMDGIRCKIIMHLGLRLAIIRLRCFQCSSVKFSINFLQTNFNITSWKNINNKPICRIYLMQSLLILELIITAVSVKRISRLMQMAWRSFFQFRAHQRIQLFPLRLIHKIFEHILWLRNRVEALT